MSLPQFPNFFYGDATVNGAPASEGMTVTAVVDKSLETERHYVLAVTPAGKFGSGNGLKLKVGGDTQGDINHLSSIQFFVTDGPLPVNANLVPAAEYPFYSDGSPHITQLELRQD